MTFFVPPSEDPSLILPELLKSRCTCGVHLNVDGMETQEGDQAGTMSLVSLFPIRKKWLCVALYIARNDINLSG